MCLGELFDINKIVKLSDLLLIWSICAQFCFLNPVYNCQLGRIRWLLSKIPTLNELGKQHLNFPSDMPEVKGKSG